MWRLTGSPSTLSAQMKRSPGPEASTAELDRKPGAAAPAGEVEAGHSVDQPGHGRAGL